jgi:hypothetical protein
VQLFHRIPRHKPEKAVVALMIVAVVFAWLATFIAVACKRRNVAVARFQFAAGVLGVAALCVGKKFEPRSPYVRLGDSFQFTLISCGIAMISAMTVASLGPDAADGDSTAARDDESSQRTWLLAAHSGRGMPKQAPPQVSHRSGATAPELAPGVYNPCVVDGAGAGRGPASAFIPLASSTRIQGGTAADGTAVIAGQQSTIGVGMSANIINLILAVDCSGSMAGSRWRSVQQGVAEAIGQLSDVDVVTIIPFNNTVQAIGPAPKCRFPLHAFAALSPGGNTMLYDATVLALITALELHRAVDQATHLTRTTYVVVMTDGEDNGSRTNLEVIKELLLQINRFRDFEVRCRCSNTGASLAPPSH